MSRSLRARGLKLSGLAYMYPDVALFTGAWIENRYSLSKTQYLVALRARGLKTLFDRSGSAPSRALYGRVD